MHICGLVVAGVMSGTPLVASAADNSCVECHKSEDYYAKHPRLHAYYRQWVDSPHALAGTTCDECHGGRPRESQQQAAHKGVLPIGDPNSRLYFKNQPRTCGRCHGDKQQQFKESNHYAALMEERSAPSCTTCHPAMSTRPGYRSIVLDACRTCHREGNEAGLPIVADKVERALHQLNIARGLLGWSTIHYEALGWPQDSRDQISELTEEYESIVTKVHRFDLEKTYIESAEFLGRLRGVFDDARESTRSAPDDT